MIALHRPRLFGYSFPAGITSFSITFPDTENPLSLGSVVTQGGDVGLDWQNMQCVGGSPGTCYGTGVSDTVPVALYNDNICTFQGFAISTTKHYAQMTVRFDAGYTPADSHEVELLLGFTISAHNAAGYEMDFLPSLLPVRWNGPLADFDNSVFTTISGESFSPADGDVIKVVYDSTSGSPVFTVTQNGVQKWVFTDTTAGKITSGYPGMGQFLRPGVAQADWPKYAFHAFSCGDA